MHKTHECFIILLDTFSLIALLVNKQEVYQAGLALICLRIAKKRAVIKIICVNGLINLLYLWIIIYMYAYIHIYSVYQKGCNAL